MAAGVALRQAMHGVTWASEIGAKHHQASSHPGTLPADIYTAITRC